VTAPRLRRLLGRPWIAVAAIVIVSVALRLPLLWGPQLDYDEGVYWESLRAMAAGHPLFTSVYSSQPPGFLVAMAPFYVVGHGVASARAGVLVFFAVALLAAYASTRTLLGTRAALVATVLLAADPLMLRQSVALQADGPAMALGLVALAMAAFSTRRRGADAQVAALLAGAALMLALLVKLLARRAAPRVARRRGARGCRGGWCRARRRCAAAALRRPAARGVVAGVQRAHRRAQPARGRPDP